MKMRGISFIGVLCIALASCTAAKNSTTATTYPDGRREEVQQNSVVAFGGRGANSNRGTMWDNEKSFNDLSWTAMALGASYFGAVSTKATEGTKRAVAASAAKTDQAKIAADAAVATEGIKAKAAATSHAISSGAVPVVNPITPP
jgi:hypothetical protein